MGRSARWLRERSIFDSKWRKRHSLQYIRKHCTDGGLYIWSCDDGSIFDWKGANAYHVNRDGNNALLQVRLVSMVMSRSLDCWLRMVSTIVTSTCFSTRSVWSCRERSIVDWEWRKCQWRRFSIRHFTFCRRLRRSCCDGSVIDWKGRKYQSIACIH